MAIVPMHSPTRPDIFFSTFSPTHCPLTHHHQVGSGGSQQSAVSQSPTPSTHSAHHELGALGGCWYPIEGVPTSAWQLCLCTPPPSHTYFPDSLTYSRPTHASPPGWVRGITAERRFAKPDPQHPQRTSYGAVSQAGHECIWAPRHTFISGR